VHEEQLRKVCLEQRVGAKHEEAVCWDVKPGVTGLGFRVQGLELRSKIAVCREVEPAGTKCQIPDLGP
jgi:hypothetical protein